MNKTLHLTIKKKWFDMILSGEKTEEYRDIKPYYNLRLIGREYDTVVFRNGYARDAPSLTIELKTIRFGIGKPEWGAEEGKTYFVLLLGKIINTKNINK
ncbi:MAG: ASCH domain-containing protein [Capnocytophaga endodontalis]